MMAAAKPIAEQLHIAERYDARKELEPWLDGGLRLERADGSAMHRLETAQNAGLTFWLLAPLEYDPTIRPISDSTLQLFVVQHDWAKAFEGATDFEAGDFQLPFEHCVFEFRISGKRVCAFIVETKGQKQITVLVETKTKRCGYAGVWSAIRTLAFSTNNIGYDSETWTARGNKNEDRLRC